MHKKLILGTVLFLTLTLAFPVTAAEEPTFAWPSFDVVEWVFGLLDVFASFSSTSEIGPGLEPGGENPPLVELAPEAEPDDAPTQEIGPGYEPWG